MSRIYGFSISRVSRAISSFKAARHRSEVNETIAENASLSKNEQHEYSLTSVQLNENTRMTSLIFQENTKYRTIERYVTRDYVRYPVYSGLRTKTKTIRKTIKLTNKELENLKENDDDLIADFAAEIITDIGKENLYPSWLWNEIIENDYMIESQSNESVIAKEKEDFSNEADRLRNEIDVDFFRIEESKRFISKHNATIDKQRQIIQKINKYKKSLFLDIITISIHFFLRSPARKKRHESKIATIEAMIGRENDNIACLTSKIDGLQKTSFQKDEEHTKFVDEYKKKTEVIEAERKRMLSEVKPLPLSVNEKDNFVPLKSFAGLRPEKIVGCYVIKNRENERCYVGQSKDVMKRLAQHFNGTMPKNAVFAEDYYYSKISDKSDLFEVKIFPLATKDELDQTEKELIACYDSFNKGYNGTNGNL